MNSITFLTCTHERGLARVTHPGIRHLELNPFCKELLPLLLDA